MNFKKWILQEEISIKKQAHEYDCGPAALYSILSHFNIKNINYKKLTKQCKTTTSEGTKIDDIVKVAKYYGITATKHHDMSIQELQKLSNKMPVMVNIQSWGNKQEKKNIESGHFVIVTKVDDDFVHFHDPYYLSKDKRKMKKNEFINNWIDDDSKKIIHHFGMSFRKKSS